MTTLAPAHQAKTTPRSNQSVASTNNIRGFALYVGLAEDNIPAGDPRLGEIVQQIKLLVAELAPSADTHATVALAPQGLGGRDIDVVRLALGEPGAQAREHTNDDIEEDRAGGVTIDLTRKQLLLDNIEAPLTYREFELLQFFVLREGRTVAREEVVEGLWHDAPETEQPNERTIDVHVRRLRVKLAQYQGIIRTVRGTGYRFDRHADVVILHSGAPSPDLF